MAHVSTYLNFPNNTEDAFNYYKSIFRGEFDAPISRFGDMPPQEGQPPIAESMKNLVMHVDLPILGGTHRLLGTDAPKEFGFDVQFGNNVYICLSPDTREETKRLFDALSEEGNISMELQDMFWGDYFGSCTDKFGVQWMFNCNVKA